MHYDGVAAQYYGIIYHMLSREEFAIVLVFMESQSVLI